MSSAIITMWVSWYYYILNLNFQVADRCPSVNSILWPGEHWAMFGKFSCSKKQCTYLLKSCELKLKKSIKPVYMVNRLHKLWLTGSQNEKFRQPEPNFMVSSLEITWFETAYVGSPFLKLSAFNCINQPIFPVHILLKYS